MREFWIYDKPDFWQVTEREQTALDYPSSHPIIHVREVDEEAEREAEEFRKIRAQSAKNVIDGLEEALKTAKAKIQSLEQELIELSEIE